MLTPEYLSKVTEQSEQYAGELRSYIIRQIIRRMMERIGRGEAYLFTATDKWQIDILQDAGILLEDIRAELIKYTRRQDAELMAAMEEAGIITLKADDAIYESAGMSPVPLKQSPHLARLMERNYNTTKAELQNFTRTTAEEAQRLYINSCDTAYHLVSSGAVSYSTAVQQTVQEAISSGGTVKYPSGHIDTLETAVARSVRTGINQATGDIQLKRMEEMDWDIIGTTAHLGARTGSGGTDHTNHLWWQGQFYTRTGRTPGLQDFYMVTGYGKVDGLCGANCRHGFFPGDGKNNPYRSFNTEENARTEKQQMRQRELERRIRGTKRELAGLKEAIDGCRDEETRFGLQQKYDRKKNLLKTQNQKYVTYCKENGLKELRDRLRIAK
jgi:hypothetical protein